MAAKSTPRQLQREKTTLSTKSDDSDSKESISVYCRLRPLKQDEDTNCVRLQSATTLLLTTPADSKSAYRETAYKFKHIFTAYASQNEIFQHIAYPLVEDLVHGKNGLLFSYGITGSGKTYTLTGDQNDPGIMPRCINTIFNTIGDRQAPKYVIKSDRMNGFEIQTETDANNDKRIEMRNCKTPRIGKKIRYINDGKRIPDLNDNNALYSIFITYIEIYNNVVYDLLEENNGRTLQGKILREDSQKNMYVNGVVEVEVKSAEEAFEVYNLGQKRKRMGMTTLNAESSRSHSIFTIRIVQYERMTVDNNRERVIPETNRLRISQLSLVDLAGSERTNRTNNTGKLLKEAGKINNSLMCLRTCLSLLRENQLYNAGKLIPYRDSRLTLLFKSYFEGEGAVSMIVCLNPTIENFEENLQVVKFAEISQDIKVAKSDGNRYTPYKRNVPNTPVTTPHETKTSTLDFGPRLPKIKLNFDDPQESIASIDKLLNILKVRKQKELQFNTECVKRETHLRQRLLQMNQDHLINLTEAKSTKTLLRKEKQKNHHLENKLNDAEVANANLETKIGEYQNMIRTLENTIDEKNVKLNQHVLEREKFKHKLALNSERMTQELDLKLRRQRDHMKAEMKANEERIHKAKQLLEGKENIPITMQEEMDVRMEVEEGTSVATPQKHPRRNMGTPAVRRRSRSVGDFWLEHNSVKPVPLNTVMQPVMRKRKSVTKLYKATDVTNSKQTKYCLITQDQDNGDVETKLYKGDILPTCGGGAQVIFNDIEKLTQESPTQS